MERDACSIWSFAAAMSSTARVRRVRGPTSASRTAGSSAIGRRRRCGRPRHRRHRQDRQPRIHRRAHPLRRAGVLGRRAHAVAAAWRHHGARRQLRLHHRPALGRRRRRRLPHADAGPGRGHAAGVAAARASRGRGVRTAEYLDELEGRVGPNVGFMVGHSAIRRVAMGAEANKRAATADELDDDVAPAARRARSRWPRASRRLGRGPTTTPTGRWCRPATPTTKSSSQLCRVTGEFAGHVAGIPADGRGRSSPGPRSSWPTCPRLHSVR